MLNTGMLGLKVFLHERGECLVSVQFSDGKPIHIFSNALGEAVAVLMIVKLSDYNMISNHMK